MVGVQQSIAERANAPAKKRSRTARQAAAKPETPREGDRTSRTLVVRRVRVYPNQGQRQTLYRWAGSVRKTFNLCKEEFEASHDSTLKNLRAKCANRGADIPTWLFDTPCDVRDTGVRDFKRAVQNARLKYQSTGQASTISFRSRKAPQQTMDVLKKHWEKHRTGVFAALFHSKRLRQFRDRWKLPSVLPSDSKLTITRTGKFYLNIPTPIPHPDDAATTERDCACENQACDCHGRAPVAAIDPGVRTFATVYTGNQVVEWGSGSMRRITHLALYSDRVRRRRDAAPTHRKRYRLTRALLRIGEKIRNLVADLHHKFGRWLVDSCEVILLPSFDTSQMVRRLRRRIPAKTARMMCTLSHYKFRQRLFDKLRMCGDGETARLHIVSEAYTSKTCGRCGAQHDRLGGSKVFRCPSCHVRLDRDANGARNILLRFLTENAEEPPDS